MFLSRRLIFLAACFAAALAAQPVVFEGGAVNVASYVPFQLPNYGIAQGSLFTIFGEAMGPEEPAVLSAFPATSELAGSSVQVTVGNTTVDCLMVVATAGRLVAILPSETPVGEGTLTVTFNGVAGNAIAIRVVDHAPGIFTISQSGIGPAAVTDAVSYAPNTVVNSFAPGDPAILWVTGLGARTADATPQLEDLQGSLNLTLRIGNKTVTDFLYAGPAPTNAGLDQINFYIPQDAQEGCAVSVVLQVGDAVSNFTQMSIASDDAVCDDDPIALRRADIKKQQAEGTLRLVRAFFDTDLSDAALVTGNPAIDPAGKHAKRIDSISVLISDAASSNSNPLTGNAEGSCSVVDQLYTNQSPPGATTPLPGNVTPVAFVTDPSGMMATLPANLVLLDQNNTGSTGGFTFIKGQQWSADIALTLSALMRTDESHLDHVLRIDPEPFADWDPAGWQTQIVDILRGGPHRDLLISDLPTTEDHLVAGSFIFQNAVYKTTVSCTEPGKGPFVIPEYALHSLNCGPLSPCNGFGVLTIFDRRPSTAGMTIGTPNSIGSVEAFDRVRLLFTFNLPEAAK